MSTSAARQNVRWGYPPDGSGHHSVLGWFNLGLGLGIVSLMTYWLWQHRFEDYGDKPLRNATFEDGTAHWAITGEAGIHLERTGSGTVVTLDRKSGEPVPTLRQRLADANQPRFIWIRCRMACENLTGGLQSWQGGRVIVYGVDAAGDPIWNQEHHLAVLHGSQPWRAYEAVLELAPETHQVWVALQNQGTSGVFRVKELAVRRVVNARHLPLLSAGLLCIWLVWLTQFLGQLLGSAGALWRRLAGAMLTLGAAWLLVLPGTRTVLLPLSPAGFRIRPPTAGTTPGIRSGSPGDLSSVAAGGSSQGAPSAIHDAPLEKTAARKAVAASLRMPGVALSHVNRSADWLHAIVYFVLGTVLFFLMGSWRAWPICVVLFVASQGVQGIQLRQVDASEVVEILWAALGLSAALLTWRLTRKWLGSGTTPVSPAAIPPPGGPTLKASPKTEVKPHDPKDQQPDQKPRLQ